MAEIHTLLTPQQYAEHLGVPHGTVRRWCGEGLPIAYDFGNAGLKIDPNVADGWVAEHRFYSVAFHELSVIYFAQAGTTGNIRIGCTADLERRLFELQRGVSAPVRVLALVLGDKALEQKLHAKLARFHVKDGWFAPAPAIFEVLRRAGASVG